MRLSIVLLQQVKKWFKDCCKTLRPSDIRPMVKSGNVEPDVRDDEYDHTTQTCKCVTNVFRFVEIMSVYASFPFIFEF